jgi:hypothetical protein
MNFFRSLRGISDGPAEQDHEGGQRVTHISGHRDDIPGHDATEKIPWHIFCRTNGVDAARGETTSFDFTLYEPAALAA